MPITNSLRENLCATAYDVFLETFRRKSYLEPERKLMLAVLENGVECFQKYAFARDRKGRLLFQEVEYWVQDTDRDWKERRCRNRKIYAPVERCVAAKGKSAPSYRFSFATVVLPSQGL